MKPHYLIINFKTYKESTGKNALKIVKAANNASKKNRGKIILVPQATDIRTVCKNTSLDVFGQHADTEEQGGHTGTITLEALKQAGAKGVLINHSEKRLSADKINETIKLCKKKNMQSVLCVKDDEEAKKYADLKPCFIAVEPPELIGGKISISDANPELIKKTVETCKNIKVLCGAGIHTEHDTAVSTELGAEGVLVASGVIKARNIEKEITLLLKGLKHEHKHEHKH